MDENLMRKNGHEKARLKSQACLWRLNYGMKELEREREMSEVDTGR